MLSNTIKTRDHLELIINILSQYGLTSDNLEIVTSTQSWIAERGIKSINRDILGFSTVENNHTTKTKREIIVLLEEMHLSDIKSVLSKIDYPVKKPIKHLMTDQKFIEHLALHQIGHVVKGISQADEEKADDFAFQEMGLY
jgi:hypothetical protein